MTIDLTGQRVLVVGAAGGIGKATTEAFAAMGATIAAAGRTKATVEAVARSVAGEAIQLDVRDNDQVEALFADRPPFDHVIVAAASTIAGPVAGLSLDDARAAMESKFWGAYRIARAAKVNDGGSITFLSGVLSERPSPTSVLQGAINAALEALARGLALERAPVRVNTISPGLIDTPLHDRMAADARHALYGRMTNTLPVRRMGQALDVAQAIVLVATNAFITGSTLNIDGGGRIA
jgi:NAD(P)-dependent dehydrogenase (short-subunit alcohol dehydrogenase family)